VLTFSRRAGSEELVIAINMSNSPFFGSVEAGGSYEEITPDIGQPLPPDDEKAKTATVKKSALPALSLDSFGFRIFRRK